MRFPDDWIRRVRESNDIVAVVGEHLRLVKAGKDYKGLCPFHADHTPSMFVSPSKQIFKCFSCGAAGSVIGFVQKYHKLDFPEALKMLAERVAIPLPVEHGPPQPTDGPASSDLVKINAWAADFYSRTLRERSTAEAARAYVAKRGLSAEIVATFQIGYAPAGWDNLLTAATQAGYKPEWLLKAGLLKERPSGDGVYDAFRDRLMFPIHDGLGRIIGFGGRTLGDDQPKYLNTAATALFDKGRCLFGLHQAREALSSADQAIVMEGYTDVCMAHQHGIRNAVATLGTALTADHIRLLKRFVAKIVMVYDGDEAGIKAMDRSLEVAIAEGGSLSVALLPDELDPCDLLVARGREPFEAALSAATDAMEFLWRRTERTLAPDAPYEQRHAAIQRYLSAVIGAAATRLLNTTDCGLEVNRLYRITGMPVEEIQREVQRAVRHATAGGGKRFADPRPAAYEDILGCALVEPALLAQAAGVTDLGEIGDFRLFYFLKLLLDRADLGEPVSLSDLLDQLPHPPTHRWLIEVTERVEQAGEVSARIEHAVQALLGYREQQRLHATAADVRLDSFQDRPGSADKLRELQSMARRPDPRRVGPAV